MNKNLTDTAYSRLLSDISALYERTHFSVVVTLPGPVRGKLYTYSLIDRSRVDVSDDWVIVDCGFHSYTRQKLRLRRIDAPELDTPQGKKASSLLLS